MERPETVLLQFFSQATTHNTNNSHSPNHSQASSNSDTSSDESSNSCRSQSSSRSHTPSIEDDEPNNKMKELIAATAATKRRTTAPQAPSGPMSSVGKRRTRKRLKEEQKLVSQTGESESDSDGYERKRNPRPRRSTKKIRKPPKPVLDYQILTSPHISKRPKEASGNSRKTLQSLALHCERFLLAFRNTAVGATFLFENVAKQLKIENRRLYDVFHILASVGIVQYHEKGKYTWHCFTRVAGAICQLQRELETGYSRVTSLAPAVNGATHIPQANGNAIGVGSMGVNRSYHHQSQLPTGVPPPPPLPPNQMSPSRFPPGGGSGPPPSLKSLVKIKLQGGSFSGAGVGEETERTERRKLTRLCRIFVQLFLNRKNKIDMTSHDDAVTYIARMDADLHAHNPDQREAISRRLYDIVNVFVAIQLIEKVPGRGGIIYRWLGTRNYTDDGKMKHPLKSRNNESSFIKRTRYEPTPVYPQLDEYSSSSDSEDCPWTTAISFSFPEEDVLPSRPATNRQSNSFSRSLPSTPISTVNMKGRRTPLTPNFYTPPGPNQLSSSKVRTSVPGIFGALSQFSGNTSAPLATSSSISTNGVLRVTSTPPARIGPKIRHGSGPSRKSPGRSKPPLFPLKSAANKLYIRRDLGSTDLIMPLSVHSRVKSAKLSQSLPAKLPSQFASQPSYNYPPTLFPPTIPGLPPLPNQPPHARHPKAKRALFPTTNSHGPTAAGVSPVSNASVPNTLPLAGVVSPLRFAYKRAAPPTTTNVYPPTANGFVDCAADLKKRRLLPAEKPKSYCNLATSFCS